MIKLLPAKGSSASCSSVNPTLADVMNISSIFSPPKQIEVTSETGN
jgi:hypothetical protein